MLQNRLEVIANVPQEDGGAGEMEQAEEVVDVPFPASHKPPEVVEPGKELFHLPAAARRTHRPSCVIVSDTRVGWSARKRALRVAWTSCGSYGEALATGTATGRPWRS